MTICINRFCQNRNNPNNLNKCEFCGNSLVINNQYILLRQIDTISSEHTEVFEVLDELKTNKDKSEKINIMKVLTSSKCPNYRERFRLVDQEALALSKLEHPGIPKLITQPFTFTLKDSFSEIKCLVMEKIEGVTLDDYMLVNKSLFSQSLALDWLQQLVDILDYIHSKGFIHQDIKPSNIMLKPDGQLVLIDFGALQEINEEYLCKISRGLKGSGDSPAVRTQGYSPPEQIRGRVVPQSDFYALGRTFVFLLTAVYPFLLPSESNLDKIIWRDKAPQIDQSFANFIDCLMEVEVGKRPLSTQIIYQFLQDNSTPSSIQLSQVDKSLSISGRVELYITLIINTLPESIRLLENNQCEFSIHVGRQMFVILTKNKIIKKLEHLQEISPRWEVALSSKKWQKRLGIYIIDDLSPNFKTLYKERKRT